MSQFDEFYPVVVRESRYGGVYSGGDWVLTAGCYSPGRTDAFGSDVPCNEFWTMVKLSGPMVELDMPQGEEEIYVASGDDPSQLIDEAKEYLSDYE